MKYERIPLERIELTEDASAIILLRNRGSVIEGQPPRMERVATAINGGDAVWFLFETLRDEVLRLRAEVQSLRKPKAKPARKARAA
jgi:hypothetical protein